MKQHCVDWNNHETEVVNDTVLIGIYHRTYSIDEHEDDTDDEGLWLTTMAMPWSLSYIYIWTSLFIRFCS